MNMIISIYKKALSVLEKKPFRLWGISLMCILLVSLAYTLGGPVLLIGLCASIMLGTAMTVIYLKGFLGEEYSLDNLFDCFRDGNTAKRVLGGMGWMYLWVFIWSLIPIAGIVFGMIRSYEYRFTPYILMKEPEVGIKDAIKVSKERTNGYKGKMFGADLLWLVAFLIVLIILSCLSAVKFIGWLFLIVMIVLIVAVTLLSPLFLGLVQSAFYVESEKRRIGSPFYEEPSVETKREGPVCPKCGSAVNETDTFCSSCGTKLSKEETEPAADVIVPEEIKAETEEIKEEVKEKAKKESKKTAKEETKEDNKEEKSE